MWTPWLNSPRRHRNSPPPSPSSPSHCRTPSVNFSCSSFKDIQSLIQEKPEPNLPKTPSLFRRVRISTTFLRALGAASRTTVTPSSKVILPPGLENRVVIYYTSLRVVRRTFDDCRAVRAILRCFRVSVDERDVSIDDNFRDELNGILNRKSVTLPRVFVGGVYIGGVDEVKQLHENGELNSLIERLPKTNQNGCCDCCGGFRFVVCDECNGSHKVFTEKNGFRSCLSCNANGLIRCPACFFILPRHTR
jgi:glutaredoxin domain-containing cysteine-rich protein 1